MTSPDLFPSRPDTDGLIDAIEAAHDALTAALAKTATIPARWPLTPAQRHTAAQTAVRCETLARTLRRAWADPYDQWTDSQGAPPQ